MKNLEQLTATRKSCERLTELGILPISFLWHIVEDDDTLPPDKEGNPILRHEVCLLACPVFSKGIYGTIPAWTKAELDIMIGPGNFKPDLLWEDEATKSMDREQYAVFYPKVLRLFKNGAEAAADVLIYLLQNQIISPKDANERYSILFQP